MNFKEEYKKLNDDLHISRQKKQNIVDIICTSEEVDKKLNDDLVENNKGYTIYFKEKKLNNRRGILYGALATVLVIGLLISLSRITRENKTSLLRSTDLESNEESKNNNTDNDINNNVVNSPIPNYNIDDEGESLVKEVMAFLPDMYVAEMLYASEDKIIFYDTRALLVYSIKYNRIVCALDLQKAGLNYIDTEYAANIDGTKILIYNSDGGSENHCYEIRDDLYNDKILMLDSFEIKLSEKEKEEFLNNKYKEYIDTVDYCGDNEEIKKEKVREYSKYGCKYGKDMVAYLYIDKAYVSDQKNLQIMLQDLDNSKRKTYNVFEGMGEPTEAVKLPEYIPEGDHIKEVLYKGIQENLKDEKADVKENQVLFPYPDIIKISEENEILSIIVSNRWDVFESYGNQLLFRGGARVPTRYTFVMSENGEYELSETFVSKDGSYYLPSLREICGLREGEKDSEKEKILQELLNYDHSKERERMLENLREYIEKNNLSYKTVGSYDGAEINIFEDK